MMREVIARAVLNYRGDDPDASLVGDKQNFLWMEYADTELQVILDAISEAVQGRIDLYTRKRERHDPFAEETCNVYEMVSHTIEAFEVFKSMIEASQESE